MDSQAHFPPQGNDDEPRAEFSDPHPAEAESSPTPGPLPHEPEAAPEPSGPTRCPLCRGEVAPDAIRCAHCGDLLRHFKVCPKCAEKVHEEARVCRHCTHDFDKEKQRRGLVRDLSRNPHKLAANPFGVLFSELSITGLFFPPELTINGDELLLSRWSLLGLRRLDQRIAVRKIASVRYMSGVIWGGIVIETFGGAMGDLVMGGLDKPKANETAQLLEQIVATG